MNQLGTFVWLRWRLFINQLKRGGLANRIILGILAVQVVLASVVVFGAAIAGGILLMPKVPASVQLLIWDALVFAFLVAWTGGLLNELQRSEALSMDKFLHLPVSLSGLFVLNYLSSFASLTLLFFVPMLTGLALGQIVGIGPGMLVVVPLLFSFVFAVTALSYQFQGWLAAIMVNKRRRRTIVMVATFLLIAITQSPQLVNWYVQSKVFGDRNVVNEKLEQLEQDWKDGTISKEQHDQQARDVFASQPRPTKENTWEQAQQAAWIANVAIPVCWLPLGSASAAEGNVLPALLATAAFALVGAVSLRRAYRTVLRIYTGEFSAANPATAAPVASASPVTAPRTTWLDRTIPWLSEEASAIALGGLRSLTRAPETKMLLLSPLLVLVVMGGLFFRGVTSDMPVPARLALACGLIGMILVMLMQLMGNQFGFDRAGFRLFVLSPTPRGDILLGKNLAMAPIVVLMVLPVVVTLELFVPLRVDHLSALPGQFVSMFLLFCLWANTLSIVAPTAIAAGSLKPANPKGWMALVQLFFLGLLPLTLAPTMLPLGVESLLSALGVGEGLPICLVLTYVECALVIWLYRLVLGWQGGWLEGRELTILEKVTAKVE